MLDFLIDPRTAEKKPWKMFFVGLLYSTIAIIISLWVFNSHATLVMVFLTVLSCMHFVYIVLKMEEQNDMQQSSKFLLKDHSLALSFLIFLFLGFTVSYSLWYIFLPGDLGQSLFSSQIDAYGRINGASGAITSGAVTSDYLWPIFFNNLRVLLFTVLFAFFYGAGTIFIFAWNASVIGFAIGNLFRENIASTATGLGFLGVASYFSSYSQSVLRYLTHGVFEIIAYFMAALGAGIITIAVIRHDYKNPKFIAVLKDSVDLLVLSVVILLFAAVVEVYVTPLFF